MRQKLVFLLVLLFFTQSFGTHAQTNSTEQIQGLFTDPEGDVEKSDSDTTDDPVIATGKSVDILSVGYATDGVNTTHTRVMLNVTFADVPSLNSSIDLFLQLSVQPRGGDISEFQVNYRFSGTPSATTQTFFRNNTQTDTNDVLLNDTDGNTFYVESVVEMPDGIEFTNDMYGDYILRANMRYFENSTITYEDDLTEWFYVRPAIILPPTTNNVGSIFNDSIDDVVSADRYTNPDAESPATADFIDITQVGFDLGKVNGTAVVLKMNATFTATPIINASTDFFFQFAYQPEDEGFDEFQLNFRIANGNPGYATTQIFTSSGQTNTEFLMNRMISGNTLSVEAIFATPTDYDLTAYPPGSYLVRLDAEFDPDLTTEGVTLEDNSNTWFSINEGGEVSESIESPEVGVPLSPFALFGIILIPVVRASRKIHN